jgi:hypothetical protein
LGGFHFDGAGKNLCIFALRRAVEKTTLSGIVRWCNGNTAPFGGVIHGSNPCRTAIFPKEIEGFLDSRTNLAPILAESEVPKMKFRKVIRHRKTEVIIHGKKPNYPF